MTRTVITSLIKDFQLQEYELVLTPTKAIARSLGTANQTLENVAQTIVKQKGFRIASVLVSRRLLQQAISEVLAVKDLIGISQLWTPTVQEFLANGLDLVALSQHPVARVADLARVATIYQQLLRQRRLIERSELFWLAAELVKEQKSCLVYGYFLPNKAIATFINALAKAGSCWVLPIAELEIFTENQAYLTWLTAQDWQISHTKETPNTFSNWNGESTTIPQGLVFNVYPNLEKEVRGVLAQVKNLLNQGVKAQEIVLVTQDEPLYGGTLLDVAWEYAVPVRAFYDVSLNSTRFGAWLELLLAVLLDLEQFQKLDFDSVTKLLAHPLVNQINQENWQNIRSQYPQTLADWQELEFDLTTLKLPEAIKSDRWLEIWQELFNQLGVTEGVKPWAKEVVAYYKFQESLQEL